VWIPMRHRREVANLAIMCFRLCESLGHHLYFKTPHDVSIFSNFDEFVILRGDQVFTITRMKTSIPPQDATGNKGILVQVIVINPTIKPRGYARSGWWDKQQFHCLV